MHPYLWPLGAPIPDGWEEVEIVTGPKPTTIKLLNRPPDSQWT
jgi:uncharacterized protein YbdZ (MbtH family)